MLIIRNRTIRTSSRLASSVSYKVDTKKVKLNDTLVVNVNHESSDFQKSYSFNGQDVANKNSISFRAIDYGTHIDISWSGAQPKSTISEDIPIKKYEIPEEVKESRIEKQTEYNYIRGLPYVASEDCKVLILGTMPGNESLKKEQYYAHPQNLFWRLVTTVFQEDNPSIYADKLELLAKHNIAIWDICKTCFREGSLDSEIVGEEPNDLKEFINEHKTIEAVFFNGKKSAKLFGKYFMSIPGIRLIVLPSSSPANTTILWEDKLREWRSIKNITK